MISDSHVAGNIFKRKKSRSGDAGGNIDVI
jgi:hypothetical protein